MRLLDKFGVAERLAMTPNAVMILRKRGRPFFSDKGVKIGQAIRWKESDLDDFISGLDYHNAA